MHLSVIEQVAVAVCSSPFWSQKHTYTLPLDGEVQSAWWFPVEPLLSTSLHGASLLTLRMLASIPTPPSPNSASMTVTCHTSAKLCPGLGSAIRDTRFARQPAQYVNMSIRSNLLCQYALPFKNLQGALRSWPQSGLSWVRLASRSLSAHCDQEKWFWIKRRAKKRSLHMHTYIYIHIKFSGM